MMGVVDPRNFVFLSLCFRRPKNVPEVFGLRVNEVFISARMQAIFFLYLSEAVVKT